MSLESKNDSIWHAKFFYAGPPLLSSIDEDGPLVELPSFLELHSATRHYRAMADAFVKQLSMSHEVALRTEAIFNTTQSMSHHLEQKISKAAELLEHNAFVLEEMLKPFPVNTIETSTNNLVCKMGVENPAVQSSSSDDIQQTNIARYIPSFSARNSNGGTVNEEQPYVEAVQIIAHLTRDWSNEGAILREDYSWIKKELFRYHQETAQSTDSVLSPILVPGAGIGRLAFDLAFAEDEERTSDCLTRSYPFAVEAMDNSIVMAAAAHYLYHIYDDSSASNEAPHTTIYPFVSDSLSNEVDTQRRWESVQVPEQSVTDQLSKIHNRQPSQRPRLSYTVGEFVTTYSCPSKQGQYGSLVSVFFIDTATNIFEYIWTIKHTLKRGGIWINYGPVQWHQNAQLHPTTDELRDMVEAAGFEVKHWEVSEKLVAYRHPDDLDSIHSKDGRSRSTRSEAYRPLKFVAVLKSSDSHRNGQEDCLLSSIQKVRLSTDRQSIVQNRDFFAEDDE